MFQVRLTQANDDGEPERVCINGRWQDAGVFVTTEVPDDTDD